ncbi:MAG: hypothetical protein GXO74_10710 [Calditrichaeota bacterium]|nr:hypothetical protein [Calditrichota bacterium]
MQNRQQQKKLLLIGLEGATFTQLKPLIEQKKLPFFSRLYALGLHGSLKSTYPINRASTWASFFSGKNPGKHNVFDFLDYRADAKLPTLTTRESIKSKVLWNYADQAGLKTILFNVPILQAPEPVNGVLVSGFLTPEGESLAYPDSLNNQLQRQGYVPEVEPKRKKNDKDYFRTAIDTVKRQFTVFRDLLINREWDLALFTSNVLDRIQPLYWNDCDKIERVYLELDSLLGSLDKILSDDVSVIIFSNFGYSPINKKLFVNEWLWEKGLQQRKISTEKNFISDIDEYFSAHSNGNGRIIPGLLAKSGITKNNIRSVLPNNVSEVLNKAVPRSVKKLFHTEYLNIIWNKSKAFFISNNLQGIQLNVKGREPFGIVDSGKEYKQLQNQIISELYHMKDPYTFEYVFEDLYRREDIFSGEYAQNAPDVILVPRKNRYYLHPQKRTSRLCIGSANDENPIFAQRDDSGIFLMKSPEYAAAKSLRQINIVDILPSILAFFRISAEGTFDGEVRKELSGKLEITAAKKARPDFIPVSDIPPLNSSKKIHGAVGTTLFPR